MKLVPYIPIILKAVLGANVKDEMDNSVDVIDRPFWLSGRFIGTAMTIVFGGCAASIGMDIDASAASLTELASLIYDNEALLVSVIGIGAGIVRGVIGLFQRK